MATARRKSGGSLEILDEGVTIDSAVTAINLVGSGVNAYGGVSGVVTVYVPSLMFAPFFNHDAAEVLNEGVLRHVAQPTSEGTPYNIGTWTGGDNHNTVNADITWSTSSEFSILDNATTELTVTVRDVDVAGTVIATNSLILTGDDVDTSAGITIEISDWAVDNFKYKANAEITLDLSTILPSGGRFHITIAHDDGVDNNPPSTPYSKTQTLFYDINTVPATIGNTSIVENTVTGKYLSGLFYAALNDSFDISVLNLDQLNNQSYPHVQLIVNAFIFYGIGQSLTANQISCSSIDFTGWTPLYNNTGSSYTVTGLSVDRSNFRLISPSAATAKVTSTIFDWVPVASSDSTSASLLIDTYIANSGPLAEYFTDEIYRKKSDFSTPWDSTQNLTAYDGNNGLMIQDGVLQTRWGDWSSFGPTTGNSHDYSGFIGTGSYYRTFIDVTSGVRNSATLSITGEFTLTDIIAGDVEIWINIPGRFTGACYVHGASTFSSASFNADPQNKPIRKDSCTMNTIEVSFGTWGLTPLHNYFELEIKIANTHSTIQPSSVVVSW